MGLVAILTFVVFGLVPAAVILLALERWGIIRVLPWAFAFSPHILRQERRLDPIDPTHRDGRILRGELVSVRLLPDGRCFFVPSDAKYFVCLVGEIRWAAPSSHAQVIGKMGLGSATAILSVAGYFAFSVLMASLSASQGSAINVGALLPVAASALLVLALLLAMRGIRAQLVRYVSEVEVLVRNDRRFPGTWMGER